MKIITWNCGTAFRTKSPALLDLKPDVMIIPECEDIPALASGSATEKTLFRDRRMLLDQDHAAWQGRTPRKGLGVFTGEGFELELLHNDFSKGPIWAVPLRITKPSGEKFDLLAVWSFNHRDKRNRDNNPIVQALEDFAHLLSSADLVVAGDFNNSEYWKSQKPSGFRATNTALANRGLVSAYHVATREPFGEETTPTHYWQTRKRDGRTYHIDYVYVPKRWVDRGISVRCGDYDTWVAEQRSDHVPIIVDVVD